ncbi:Fic/DOC family protein [Planococcus sp. CAU13]|uniref:Fic/DOC family protein n=1 Tax=Planococcus sp. CAU13 TaxID=1541197 RepID=UPI00052FFC10|nr:Fic family protein [Planococcus sp. CAU13]
MDPYVYPKSNLLKNKLGIKDEQELITVEAQLVIAGIVDIQSIGQQIDFNDINSIKTIHHYLFQDLYDWAGEFRTINIFKSEQVLNGLSITYSDKDNIETDLTEIFKWVNEMDWALPRNHLVSNFKKLMTDLWRVHPFREGNTRTVSIFMKLFADNKYIEFDEQLLSQNAGYLRNALVLAAVEEAPEPQYLKRIITDALGLTILHPTDLSGSFSERYQTIKDYDVSNYEEKPFTADPDINKTDE